VALARLGLICLDCKDPADLAAFGAALLGGEVAPISDDVVVVKNKGTPVAALRVPDYQPPTWPDGAIPKQMHGSGRPPVLPVRLEPGVTG